MRSSFFALISRMRYIGRWGLMRNSLPENVQEHSHMVAVIAHALAVIRRDIFLKPCEPERCAAIALFHDAPEILTGDLPTPIKYYSPELMRSYKKIESVAARRLIALLPSELRESYESLLDPEEGDALAPLVKAADKISALIKCVEERKTGNNEFLSAEKQTRRSIESMGLPEALYFLERFMPSFELTLDELETINN